MRALRRLILALILVCITAASTLPSAAQTGGGSGLSISPLHHRLSLEPSESATITITLKNITSGPIVAKPYVNDFTSDNKTGNPVIITDPDKRTPNSIRDFVSGLENVPLSVGEQKKVSATIRVPLKVAPGAYYGIIRYQAIPSSNSEIEDGQVSLSASVGTIVLIQIEGDLIEKLQLLALNIYSGDNAGMFFFNKPDQIGLELRNQGNAFAQPFGRVVVENMSGKEVYSYELNSSNPRSSVLPDTKREFKDKIKNINSPGRYKVSASVSYGPGSDVLIGQKSFWYVPAWLLSLLLIILAALLIAIAVIFRRNSRRKKRIKKHPR